MLIHWPNGSLRLDLFGMQYSNYHTKCWLLGWHRYRFSVSAFGFKETRNNPLKSWSTFTLHTLALHHFQ